MACLTQPAGASRRQGNAMFTIFALFDHPNLHLLSSCDSEIPQERPSLRQPHVAPAGWYG
jgi:hypothetical protein